MRCRVLVAGWLWLTLFASAASAQEAADCTGARPWVVLAGNVKKTLAEAVCSELRAGLSPSRIDVCAEGEGPAASPLARVVLTQEDAADARYSLDVTDSVTQKRVGRDLSLSSLPPDGRALALAVAAEELLRASWAELALRGVHSPATAPPPEVQAVVERAAQPRRQPRRPTALGARLAFEHFVGGRQTHYGADVFAAFPAGRLLGVNLALGARRALSVQSLHGSIGARALSAELGPSLRLVHQPSLELSGFVSARALWLRFEPEATGTAAPSAHSGWAFTSRAGLSLAFGAWLRSYSSLGVGLPLRSFSASDSGAEVTGTTTLELFGATGLALELP